MDAFFEDICANNVPTPPTQTTRPPAQTTGPNNEFEDLLSRSNQKLYPGCDMTTLEFTSEISHIKVLHKISDAGFNKILALLQKACPPKVDAPPVNDDNANANEDNEDDVAAHVLDDDDVVVSDDDEVNPS
ncbi:hypothetical protein Tco_1184559, partial [Tanacetum coccineum]